MPRGLGAGDACLPKECVRAEYLHLTDPLRVGITYVNLAQHKM